MDVPEGASSEDLQNNENTLSDSLGYIDISNLPLLTFSEGQIQEAQAIGTLDARTTHEGADRCEDDLKRHTKERDALKLLTGQKEEEIKDLRAELATAHKGQTDLIEQQKAEKIEQLCEEAKMKEAEMLGWKQNMDHLASKKEVARPQLLLAERQLQSMKEENSARTKRIKELEARLAAELLKATSEAEKVKADVEVVMAIYQADAEAANARAKEISDATQARSFYISEHAKCQSRRETL
ncbi:uncharacterized protein [Nicotiana sylvestris]|uniref:uncharacterized protein n=1 Tax=Nicotiana sylvestris TaxID=4096 RepID=UPI00388C96E8